MKAVLMSIKPKYCELISSGKKTVEIRKTKPKLETPFKCYIYCTASNVHECLMVNENGAKLIYASNYKTAIPFGGRIANGKVIGEFVCNDVAKILNHGSSFWIEGIEECKANTIARASCLDFADMKNYLGEKDGYAWHISDLVIYDKPKSLSDFRLYDCRVEIENGYPMPTHKINRPPQSWYYVEELR